MENANKLFNALKNVAPGVFSIKNGLIESVEHRISVSTNWDGEEVRYADVHGKRFSELRRKEGESLPDFAKRVYASVARREKAKNDKIAAEKAKEASEAATQKSVADALAAEFPETVRPMKQDWPTIKYANGVEVSLYVDADGSFSADIDLPKFGSVSNIEALKNLLRAAKALDLSAVQAATK